ncbi:MAG: HEPN domain-containing protein [Anaerolineae bacterium]
MPGIDASSAVRYPPDDPREWLNRAKSNLAQAGFGVRIPGVYFEDLCFLAQQAAEKALKAVLILQGIHFPRMHDLSQLVGLLEQTALDIPRRVREAARLTRYAVAARYPGVLETVQPGQYEDAVRIAAVVVAWCEEIIAAHNLDETLRSVE